jgi:hypothetical protein
VLTVDMQQCPDLLVPGNNDPWFEAGGTLNQVSTGWSNRFRHSKRRSAFRDPYRHKVGEQSRPNLAQVSGFSRFHVDVACGNISRWLPHPLIGLTQ